MTVLKRLDPWAPPFALMAVIFFFSAQPDLSTDLGLIDHIGRKLVHASEYGLLCFLWWRALRSVAPGERAPAIAWVVTALYAASDEIHQTFVDGRHGTPVDVLIDSCGAGVVALLVYRAHSRRVVRR
jgi:VanZ family protein